MRVSTKEIQWALSKIPANKAGPKQFAINAVYKVGAELLAPIISHFLQDWWGRSRAICTTTFQGCLVDHAGETRETM